VRHIRAGVAALWHRAHEKRALRLQRAAPLPANQRASDRYRAWAHFHLAAAVVAP
jgi:hypothetical protein